MVVETSNSPHSNSTAAALCDNIEKFLNSFAKDPPGKLYLSGNYGPVDENDIDIDLPVTGTLPECLNGEFVRVGPNPRFKPTSGYHWFDGDGMIHGVRIKDGKANYIKRFVRTSRLIQEEKYGSAKFVKFGEMVGWVGLSKIFLEKLRLALGVIDNRNGVGTANTAVVFHANRFMALHEGDAPYAIKILQDGQMETIGRELYGGKLSHHLTAHPKIDYITGEMFTFGYSVEENVKNPLIKYHVVSPEGDLGPEVLIHMHYNTMFHDFAITANYAVFMEFPLIFNPSEVVKSGAAFKWEPSQSAWFGILPRYDANDSRIRWFQLPAFFIFHTANAYENGDEVILHACRFPYMKLGGDSEMDLDFVTELHEFRFNLKTGEHSVKRLTNISGDFPRINDKYTGCAYRYAYSSFSNQKGEIEGVVKYDLNKEPALFSDKYQTGANISGIFMHGEGRAGSEAVFVPKWTSDDAEEDEGYLLNFVYDSKTNKSDMVVVDAKTMSKEPVAVVSLPDRVPYGFHGTFVSEEQLESQLQSQMES